MSQMKPVGPLPHPLAQPTLSCIFSDSSQQVALPSPMSHTQVESNAMQMQPAPIGPAFIGFIVSLSLHGVGIAQSFFYYRYFPHDGRAKKSIVLALNLVDLAQTLVLSNTFWMLICRRLIGAEGNVSRISFDLPPWQLEVCHSGWYVTATLIIATVQGFFCLRVWRVSRNNMVLAAVIIFTSLVQMCSLIYISNRCDEVMSPQAANAYFFSMPFVANIVCDGTISGSLTYYFTSYRVGMPRTEPVMQQLVWLSMGTGLILCVLTALTWALSLYDADSASYVGPLFIITRLYSNSMMANLNSRKHFRSVIERTIDYSMHASAFDTSKFATE